MAFADQHELPDSLKDVRLFLFHKNSFKSALVRVKRLSHGMPHPLSADQMQM